MRPRILSRFRACSSRENWSSSSCSMCSTAEASTAGGSDLYRDAARAEGFDFESVPGQFVGDVGEDGLLRQREFDHQRQQQALAFDFLRRPLFQNFLEQHAFVGHVLVDDPQAFGIDRQDERVANLAQRLERGQGRGEIAGSFRFVGNGRSATVVIDRESGTGSGARTRDRAALPSTEMPSPKWKRSLTGGGTGACRLNGCGPAGV